MERLNCADAVMFRCPRIRSIGSQSKAGLPDSTISKRIAWDLWVGHVTAALAGRLVIRSLGVSFHVCADSHNAIHLGHGMCRTCDILIPS